MRFLTSLLLLCSVTAFGQTSAGGAIKDPLDDMIRNIKAVAHSEKVHQDKRVAEFRANEKDQERLLSDALKEFKVAEGIADELRQTFEKNEKSLREKSAALEEKAGDLNDVFAIVRQSAVRANSLVESSMVSAQVPGRSEYLVDLAKSDRAPGITDIQSLWDALLTEINQSGKNVKFETPVIGVEGEESSQEVVRVGVFTAALGDSFLRYLPGTNKMVELARQPAYRYRQQAGEFTSSSEAPQQFVAMAMDPSKGAILSLLVQSPTFTEHVDQGGVIGYLIIGLGGIGLLILLQRFIALSLVSRKVNKELQGDTSVSNGPLARIKKAADAIDKPTADVLGIRLEDQIAEEASSLNKGLATVAVIAAVAPLLGLLGTVTGMIETFNSITLFGTGDPKLMSGGISVALVTTELGLSIAIPLVLLHSLLMGRANRVLDSLSRYSTELFSDYVNR